MVPRVVIVIRHAEAPSKGASGVREDGSSDDNDLTIRGWQRAGALAQFFRGKRGLSISTPTMLVATRASQDHPSKRGVSTLLPLSRLLSIPITDQFHCGEEAAVAKYVLSREGVVVLAWSHRSIPELIKHFPCDQAAVPTLWPDERFDMCLVLALDSAGACGFAQTPQLLLEGDIATPL
jgi:broad specificity phosphatase PhoE